MAQPDHLQRVIDAEEQEEEEQEEEEQDHDDEDDYYDDEEVFSEDDLGHVRTLQMGENRAPLQEIEQPTVIKIENGRVTSSTLRPPLVPSGQVGAQAPGPSGFVNPASKAAVAAAANRGDIGAVKLLLASKTYPEDHDLAYKKCKKVPPAGTSATSKRRRTSYGSLKVTDMDEYDPTQPCHFDLLPDEVVVKVLSFLPRWALVRVARTCKRLWNISYDSDLWSRVDFGGQWLQPGQIGRVVTRGTRVLRMSKAHVQPPVFDLDVAGSGPHQLPHLQYLDLSMANVTLECLVDLIGACTNLIRLGLEQCTVNDAVMKAVSQNTRLKTLDLGMVVGLTAQGAAMLSHLQLEELNLSWIGLTAAMKEQLRDGLLASSAPTLTKLNLSGGGLVLDDDTVMQVCKTCSKLEELDVSDCRILSQTSMYAFVHYAANLKVLGISRCYSIQPTSVFELITMPKLEQLRFYGMVHEDGVKELRKGLDPVKVNVSAISEIARPTTGEKRTSIWDMKTRPNR